MKQINCVNISRKDESCRAGRYLEVIQSFPLVAFSFQMKKLRPSKRSWLHQAHTVGLFTLVKDTSLIHGVLFVCERHRHFTPMGSFYYVGFTY